MSSVCGRLHLLRELSPQDRRLFHQPCPCGLPFLFRKKGNLTKVSQLSQIHSFSSLLEVSWQFLAFPKPFFYFYFFKCRESHGSDSP